jgi:polyisoprenoid-binding protein YceI
MRAMKYLVLAGLLGAAVSAQAAPVTYKLDPTHTDVIFAWNHLGFSNPSGYAALDSGTVVFDEKNPAKSTVEVSLPISGFDTHVGKLNEEFQSAQFFDAGKFPTATFKSTKVQALGGNKFKITGDLTVHGVTKPLVLTAHLNKVGIHPMAKVQAIGFDATGMLKRSDFGVNAYVPYVSDEIKLQITTEGEIAK